MKIKNILSAITKTGKTVQNSVKGSLKFMDDVLEKEYIVNAIDDVKQATGKIVEKGGELYENTKHSVENITEDLQEKASEFNEEVKQRMNEEEE